MLHPAKATIYRPIPLFIFSCRKAAVRQDGCYVQCIRPAGWLALRTHLSSLPIKPLPTNNVPQLAMATLGVTFGGSWLAMRGGSKEDKTQPPMNAQSKDEEAFIQYGSQLPTISH